MLADGSRVPRLSPLRLSPLEDGDVRDFRPASVALREPLSPGVTIFPVLRELFRVFTDHLWFKSGDRESHTDHELHA